MELTGDNYLDYLSERIYINSVNILRKAHQSKSGHIGGSLSMSQFLLPILIELEIVNPLDYYLILSKGHASLGLYSILYTLNINLNPYDKFCSVNDPESNHGHTCSKSFHRLLASTGSLGHGLPIAAGFSYGLTLQQRKEPVLCILGDGELQEGTTWEILLHLLTIKTNLKLIIDSNNSIDSNTANAIKCLESFCPVLHLCPNKVSDLSEGINQIKSSGFKAIVFNTTKVANIKGHEHDPRWHAGIPNDTELQEMINSLSINLKT